MSEQPVYVSRVRIERVRGSLRRAYLPAETQPVYFGLHSEVAKYYNANPAVNEPHAATFDYLVAATAG